MSATGSPLATANNLTLEAARAAEQLVRLLPHEPHAGFISSRAGAAGVLCLSGAIGRYVGAGSDPELGRDRRVLAAIDLTQTPQPTGFVSVMGGDTWNFQAWYRDVSGGVPTSNFTEGLSIVFQ
jgi:hypothetical protein